MPTTKIISWNINGIRAVMKKGFMDFLNEHKPHILGLQEVKIDNKARDKEPFDFVNYSEYWNSADRPGYSGTMTMVREKTAIHKQVLGHTQGIDHTEFDHEGRTQSLEFEKFYLINAYFPNARDDLSRISFKQEFDALILKLAKKYEKKKPVIIMGDFNVAHNETDLARPNPNMGKKGFTQEERDDFTAYMKKGFADTFRELHPDKVQYSWWSYMGGARKRNVGWRIDYVIVSKSLMPHVKKAFILDHVMGSDHCPVGIELDI